MVFNDYTGLWVPYEYAFGDNPVEASFWQTDAGGQFFFNEIASWRPRGWRACRLMFRFYLPTFIDSIPMLRASGEPASEEYRRMDDVLQLFSTINMKAIPDLHHVSDAEVRSSNGTIPSMVDPTYVGQNWINFVNHYKNSPLRSNIAALNLFNELGSAEGGDSATSQQDIVTYYVSLTQQLLGIDPTLKIIFPTGCTMGYSNATNWIQHIRNAVSATGYNILNDLRVIFDVIHPYYFNDNDIGVHNPPWDGGMTPEAKADWYTSNWIDPCIAEFGHDRCWCGETYLAAHWMWNGVDYPADLDLQGRWLTAIVNKFVRTNQEMGFQAMVAYGSGVINSGTYVQLQEDAIANSNYVQVDPPNGDGGDIALPYHNSLNSLENLQIQSGDWNIS